MVARQPGDLTIQPGMELGNQRRTAFPPHSQPLDGRFAVDGALDFEQGVEPPHGLDGDRIDRGGLPPTALPARRRGDIGQFKEFPSGMSMAAGLPHRRRCAVILV